MTAYCVVETRLGYVCLMSCSGRLARLTLPRGSRAESLEAAEIGTDVGCGEDVDAFGVLPGLIAEYFAGRRVDFSGVELYTFGWSGFRQAVMNAARHIPYGQLTSYGELARAAGFPNAARAVGRVMARNPVPVVVPCHRVVASDGSLSGFASGLRWKKRLLEIEGIAAT